VSRYVVALQGTYYLATGLWPLVSLGSFEAVTGPKIDDWLVHTVGVLAAAIGIALLAGSRRSPLSMETLTLAGASAIAFGTIDVVYALRGTISRIYLADAAVQATVVIGLLVGRLRR
jgi:energy-converting hydrogenase Eha subunit E